MYRRGIQDYEYLWLAEQLGYETEVLATLSGLLPHVMWEALAIPDWSNSNATYENARRQLAGMLEGRVHFADVTADHWAFAEIEGCYAAGVVAGYDDGRYHPEGAVARDQMAVYISRALAGGDANVPGHADGASFPDVQSDHWAYNYVEYAKDSKVVGGYDDGLYHPDWPLDRGQMAVFIARAMADPTGEEGLEGSPLPPVPTFPDVSAQFWAYKHIEYIAKQEVVRGYDDGHYHPEYTCLRDQMAAYVARAFQLGM